MADIPATTNLCRVCLCEDGTFQSVFFKDEATTHSLHLADMIMTYTSVKIAHGDGLPDVVCTECARKIVSAYRLKQRCEASDIHLRRHWPRSPKNPSQKASCVDVSALGVDPATLDVVVVKSESPIKSEERKDDAPVSDSFDEQSDEFDLHHEELEWHDDDDDEEKNFVCMHCGRVFERQLQLVEHVCADAGHADDAAATAHSFLADEHELLIRRDIEIKAEDECAASNLSNDRKCSRCGKRFKKPSHLARHMKVHSAIKPHVCTLCNRGFARAEQLLNHMNAHSGIKPHVCSTCGKGFNQISNLKDHLRTHNGEKPYLCSICGKGFNQLGNLRQHTVRHSGIKSHLCSTCGSGFASKGELCAHLRKHTGARPFVCPICNHGFTTSSSLTKHKRIHSGEKPYECEVCKMRFSRSGILARHRRTHTGEKPYVCNYCEKGFSQSNDLSSHLRIHTGEKPYICDVCGHCFRQSSALKTHKKVHEERNPILSVPVLLDLLSPASEGELRVVEDSSQSCG